MKITVGKYRLIGDAEVKSIPDGYEIFASGVERMNISPEDFRSAYWHGGSIIVESE